MVSGLVRSGTVSRNGKAITLTGLTAGAWFGEGSVLKNEPRRYDAVALRDTRLALMERATFLWLMENSVAFNRFLVVLLNERLGQFMGLLEYGRMLDATARLARCIASRFNPILYPAPTPQPGDHPGRDRRAVGISRRTPKAVPEAAGAEKGCCGSNTAASPSSISSGCASTGSEGRLPRRLAPDAAQHEVMRPLSGAVTEGGLAFTPANGPGSAMHPASRPHRARDKKISLRAASPIWIACAALGNDDAGGISAVNYPRHCEERKRRS